MTVINDDARIVNDCNDNNTPLEDECYACASMRHSCDEHDSGAIDEAIDERVDFVIENYILHNQDGLVRECLVCDVFEYEDIENLWENDGTEDATEKEVLEWWLVTPRMCSMLGKIDEPVLCNDYGCWWGRTCSGQSISMDGTIQKLVKENNLI